MKYHFWFSSGEFESNPQIMKRNVLMLSIFVIDFSYSY